MKAPPVLADAPVVDAPPPAAPAPAPGGIEIPDFRGLGVARALDLARQAHLPVDVSGSGRVVTQDPAPGPASARVRISLHFSDGE